MPNDKSPRKIRLKRETLRVLTVGEMTQIAGGFIMKDTIIIRTSGIVAPRETAPAQTLERP